MHILLRIRNHATSLLLALILVFFANSEKSHLWAQEQPLDLLFEQLADPESEDWEIAEKKIWRIWSRSGSDALDFMLERGRDAIDEGDSTAAISHLSALIDHAPDFAEGWNARATAFFMAGEFGLSMFDIQQVLRLNPRHFGALGGMGAILEQTNKLPQALVVYKRASALHPKHEQFKQAIDRLEKATRGEAL